MSLKSKIRTLISLFKEEKKIPITELIPESEILQGKVALILGGTGGIGYAIAKEFLDSGCKIIIAGTNLKKLEEQTQKLNSCNAAYMIFDYADVSSFNNKIKEAVNKFGKIDIFVSSAGVHTEKADFWCIQENEYDRVMNINLKGTYFACQEMANYMKENNIRGHILLISSSRGSEPAWSPYGISKWGLNGLTKGMAQVLLPYGIIVNAIAPGATATNLIGVKEGDSIVTEENLSNRLILPKEIAVYAKMFVSETGNMIIGETLHISAGRGVWDIR